MLCYTYTLKKCQSNLSCRDFARKFPFTGTQKVNGFIQLSKRCVSYCHFLTKIENESVNLEEIQLIAYIHMSYNQMSKRSTGYM